MKKLILSNLILLVFFAFAQAQEKATTEPYRKWEIGINGGGAEISSYGEKILVDYYLLKEQIQKLVTQINVEINL